MSEIEDIKKRLDNLEQTVLPAGFSHVKPGRWFVRREEDLRCFPFAVVSHIHDGIVTYEPCYFHNGEQCLFQEKTSEVRYFLERYRPFEGLSIDGKAYEQKRDERTYCFS